MSRIRPMIEVWCLPTGQTEDDLNRLHQGIVITVVAIQELGLKDEKDMICVFPSDLMSYGLGDEIVVKITRLSLPGKPERIGEVRQRLTRVVGSKVKEFYPNAKVECSAASFDLSQGFWSSVD